MLTARTRALPSIPTLALAAGRLPRELILLRSRFLPWEKAMPQALHRVADPSGPLRSTGVSAAPQRQWAQCQEPSACGRLVPFRLASPLGCCMLLLPSSMRPSAAEAPGLHSKFGCSVTFAPPLVRVVIVRDLLPNRLSVSHQNEAEENPSYELRSALGGRTVLHPPGALQVINSEMQRSTHCSWCQLARKSSAWVSMAAAIKGRHDAASRPCRPAAPLHDPSPGLPPLAALSHQGAAA